MRGRLRTYRGKSTAGEEIRTSPWKAKEWERKEMPPSRVVNGDIVDITGVKEE